MNSTPAPRLEGEGIIGEYELEFNEQIFKILIEFIKNEKKILIKAQQKQEIIMYYYQKSLTFEDFIKISEVFKFIGEIDAIYDSLSNLFMDKKIKIKEITEENFIFALSIPILYKEQETILSLDKIKLDKDEIICKLCEKINTLETEIQKLKNQKANVILYQKIFNYEDNIICSSKELTEIGYYTTVFETDKKYETIQVNINIPFTGLDKRPSRGRIITYLDENIICDSTLVSEHDWEMRPISISGFMSGLEKGTHKLLIRACVDENTLFIPHINKQCIEFNKEPKLSGRISIIGMN